MKKYYKFMYVNLGIDKWDVNKVIRDYDYNDPIDKYMENGKIGSEKKYLYSKINNKKSENIKSHGRRDDYYNFWSPKKNFHNIYYGCNSIAFSPYLSSYSKNIMEYLSNKKIDIFIGGEICNFDILNNYSKNLRYVNAQQYELNKDIINKIDSLYKKYIKSVPRGSKIITFKKVLNDSKKYLMIGSKNIIIENASNLTITKHKNCKFGFNKKNYNNVDYYEWKQIRDDNCKDIYKFISQIQLNRVMISGIELLIINVHNRYFAEKKSNIFYNLMLTFLDELEHQNVIVIGDFNPDYHDILSIDNFKNELKKIGFHTHAINNLYNMYNYCKYDIDRGISLMLISRLNHYYINKLIIADCKFKITTSSHVPIHFEIKK